MILDKLKCEMLKLSGSLIEKKSRCEINERNELRVVSTPKRTANFDSSHLSKRIKLDPALLTFDQVKILEELVELFNKHAKRPTEIGFSEVPILNEIELCEISTRVAQLFPDKEVKVLSL